LHFTVESAALINNIADGIISIDPYGIICAFNPAAERMFGYSDVETVGKNLSILFPNSIESNQKINLNDLLSNDSNNVNHEMIASRKDGSTFPVEVGMSEAQIDGKNMFVWIMRDISARKESEAQLQKFIAQITDSNEDLERFAYVCSHDLQEPLRMVRSYSQKLEQYFENQELDENAKKYMQYVAEGAKRAQNLISDILTYSRLDYENKHEEVDLEEVIELVKNNLSVLIEEKQAKINISNIPTVSANRMAMVQLFQNLVSNAIKYNNTVVIDIKAEETADKWLFSVRDNGIGISKEYFNKIFVIFERLHKRSEYGGSGIGLAVCKKIITRHGGQIWVESEEGKGSTFYFTLPKNNT